MEGMPFAEKEFVLQPGDLLFLYTDGVTEAVAPPGDLFGEDRTAEALSSLRGHSSQALLTAMREVLQQFAAGVEQSDDITMLGLRYFGPNYSSRDT
jgi:sigma-B regulation protein RsbU (phosphoserine phosphatase)